MFYYTAEVVKTNFVIYMDLVIPSLLLKNGIKTLISERRYKLR